MKKILIAILALFGLVACNNNGNEGAQPNIGDHQSQVNEAGQPLNVTNNNDNTNTNSQQSFDNPYNHNYNGTFSGAENTTMTNDIRSAQQVASRASEAAEQIEGVERAVSIAQGADIVVAIDTDQKGNVNAIEQRVKQVVSSNEQGYNVYVSTNPDINERIRRLFTNMNNVKTSNVTPGIGEIIYQIGQDNGGR